MKMNIAGSLLILILMFPHVGLAQDPEEIVRPPSGSPPRFIYLEKESIDAYFEITNADEYRKLLPWQ
ncbi:MAG: hypothetical protein EHM36_02815 [Deltaproteobacteria bacterium]|nr:MAG: hypothetical protein EHM36_02815 [Deltaproteobacteria bacterium]